MERKKNSIISSASIDRIIKRPRLSLIKVRDKNFGLNYNSTYLPSLSTTNKKLTSTTTTPNSTSQEQFEDPYKNSSTTAAGNVIKKTNWPTKMGRGLNVMPKQHFLSQKNISLKSCSFGNNSPVH